MRASDVMASRRDVLKQAALAAVLSALPGGAAVALEPQPEPSRPRRPARGKAEACIMLWLGGGASHIDTFDPKQRGDGKRQPGSYYDAITTAIPGARVCEHLARTARRLDRCALVRTLHHAVIDEHAAATNIVHTGRPVSGTVIYPSLGSVVAHERGPGGDGVPAYVVMGYPNVTRGPGFLGAKYGYVYLIDTESGPTGLTPPPDVVPPRRGRREALLETLRADYQAENPGDAAIADYVAASREA